MALPQAEPIYEYLEKVDTALEVLLKIVPYLDLSDDKAASTLANIIIVIRSVPEGVYIVKVKRGSLTVIASEFLESAEPMTIDQRLITNCRKLIEEALEELDKQETGDIEAELKKKIGEHLSKLQRHLIGVVVTNSTDKIFDTFMKHLSNVDSATLKLV